MRNWACDNDARTISRCFACDDKDRLYTNVVKKYRYKLLEEGFQSVVHDGLKG